MVRLGSLATAYPVLRGALRPLLGHEKEKTHWREVLKFVSAWVRAHDGGDIAPRGNRSGRAMNGRAHDALAQQRVDTGGVVRLYRMFIARDESVARRRIEEDVQRGDDEGF